MYLPINVQAPFSFNYFHCFFVAIPYQGGGGGGAVMTLLEQKI
jgi:hypothetical protein